MRVGIVTDGLYPYFKGGKEVRSFELGRQLIQRGVQVDVYTMHWWDGGPVSSHQGMTLHALCRSRPLYAQGRRSILQALIFAVSCLKLLWARVDVIDADQMPYFPLLPVRLIASLRRIPMVVTWHEWWGQSYWETYLGPVGRVGALLERFVARLGDHIVVTTAYTKARLVNSGVAEDRVTVLPLGVDVEAIAQAPPASTPIDVCYVGRLLEHKHVEVLVDALGQLRDEGLEMSCVIVGEGPEEDSLRARVTALGLDKQVSFLGRLEEQREVWGVMKCSTIFAYPTTREGFGIAALEAMACGSLVVTTDHPDNYARNLIEHGVTGLVAGVTVASLTNALKDAFDMAGDRIGGLSQVDHSSIDSWRELSGRLLEVYRQALARTRPEPSSTKTEPASIGD